MNKQTIQQFIKHPGVKALKPSICVGLGFAAVMAMVSVFIPNRYQSVTRILPVDVKGAAGFGGISAAAAAVGLSVPGQDGGDQNYVDILNSRWIKETLLREKFDFEIKNWKFGKPKKYHQSLQEYLHAKNLDRGVEEISLIMSATKDQKSKILILSVETKSPELSRDVAKSAMNLLDDFLRKKIQTRGGIKAAFATARLDEARMEMARSEDAFRRFMESNRNFQASGDPSIRLSGARFERELKLREQLVVTLAINREQALLEEKNDLPMLNFLDVPNLPLDHHGPYRLMYVLVALFSSSCLTWVWLNRLWIKRLSDN